MDNIYRIQIWVDSHWKWGIHDYTYSQATERIHKLRSVGIKARMRPKAELFR